ncbi:kinase-like domain-containing protein [Auriculariales sp. MPI-PUGE-AT-0066]|nr:kinase-like domain-containing protein [Auriculariales sp. MPI-PUGE-AT-0066]
MSADCRSSTNQYGSWSTDTDPHSTSSRLTHNAMPGNMGPMWLDDFEPSSWRELGRGSFGSVYRATHLSTGRSMAIKFSQDRRVWNNEAVVMYRMAATGKVPYNVPILGSFTCSVNGMEWHCHAFPLYAMSVQDALRNGDDLISPMLMYRWATQLVVGLTAAHARGVTHCDIKPDNILLDADGNAFLADFGLAHIGEPDDIQTAACGTLRYMSPEQHMGEQYCNKTDVWSLGVTLCELAGFYPFPSQDTSKSIDIERLKAGNPIFPENVKRIYGPQFEILVFAMLDPVPSERPSAADLRYLRYFRGVSDWVWKCLEIEGVDTDLALNIRVPEDEQPWVRQQEDTDIVAPVASVPSHDPSSVSNMAAVTHRCALLAITDRTSLEKADIDSSGEPLVATPDAVVGHDNVEVVESLDLDSRPRKVHAKRRKEFALDYGNQSFGFVSRQ